MQDPPSFTREGGASRPALTRKQRDALRADVLLELSALTCNISLMLDLVISHSNGITFTNLDRQVLERLARGRAERSTGEEVIAA